jgi:hypothetical protein
VIPTEHELTVAVDAAAEYAYRRTVVDEARSWRDVDAVTAHRFRELVLPLTTAALEAIPDRAPAARRDAMLELARRLHQRVCSSCAAIVVEEAQ